MTREDARYKRGWVIYFVLGSQEEEEGKDMINKNVSSLSGEMVVERM